MATHCFYDLSISVSQLEAETQKERTALALSLGYDGVASPHQADRKLSNADRCKIRILELEELLAATRGLRSMPPTDSGVQHGSPYTAIQRTRINIPIEDTNEAQQALSNAPVLNSFDLIAVQPLSEKAFAFACVSLHVDIISLDLTRRLSYRFKQDLIKTALSRGLHFEILYSALVREPGSRRQFFTNAQALTRETRGKGIILSSGARTALELRGPYDVVNLGTFLGLREDQSYAAIGKNAAAVLEHARKRKSFRGALSIRNFGKGMDADLMKIDDQMETEETKMMLE